MSTTEERNTEIARQTARAQGVAIVNAWMADHKEDFHPSDENSERIGKWLVANNRELSYENLDAAFVALRAQGVNFMPPTGPRVDWAKRHAADFDGSPESWAKIDAYLKTYNMKGDDQSNLEQAFQAIRGARGPKIFMSGLSVTTEPNGELPWIPSYMPEFKTKKELDAIPLEDFRKYYSGPDADAFRARCVAVGNKRG